METPNLYPSQRQTEIVLGWQTLQNRFEKLAVLNVDLKYEEKPVELQSWPF